MLIKYIRKGKKKKGVVVAVPVNEDKVKFGWSMCHRRDKFDKDFGKKIAIERALCNRSITAPKSIKKDLEGFIARATRYYKDKSVLVNIVL